MSGGEALLPDRPARRMCRMYRFSERRPELLDSQNHRSGDVECAANIRESSAAEEVPHETNDGNPNNPIVLGASHQNAKASRYGYGCAWRAERHVQHVGLLVVIQSHVRSWRSAHFFRVGRCGTLRFA